MADTTTFQPTSRRSAAMNAGAGVDADTNIIINQAPRNPRPVYTTRPRPGTSIPVDANETFDGDDAVTPPPLPSSPTAPAAAGGEINWGGIIKGVAIVTTVAVVAVVSFVFLQGIIAGMLLSPAISPIAAGVASIASPLITAVGNFGLYVSGFIGPFLGGVLGIGAAAHAIAPAAGHAALSTAAAGHAATAVAAAGTGTAVLAAAPAIGHQLGGLHLFDHHNQIAANLPDDGGSMLATHKIVSTKQAALADANALQDADHAATHAVTTAAKISHHAADDSHDHTSARAALLRAQNASQSWAAKATASNNYQSTLASTGSHAAAVEANRVAAPAIEPRTTEFAQQLDADRAKLDAALAEPAR